MKPKALVHGGPHWAVWRTTTDRPEEIRDALEALGIVEVFKGDQNQAWDAVLANHCLLRAVGGRAQVRLFVQDEKLGTPDALLARLWRETGSPRYALTEDYFRGRKGAVWEHQDVSRGLFFTEAVSPEQFALSAVHLHRLAALWAEWSSQLACRPRFLACMASLGTPLELVAADEGTRLGPAVNRKDFERLFAAQPDASLYYSLTKSTGLYGIVPARDDDVTLSSIPTGDPELRELGRRLLVDHAARGAMRATADPRLRRRVKLRAREIARWAGAFLIERPGASVADFQEALGRHLTAETFPEDRVVLSRTSDFMRLEPAACHRLTEPDETLFYVLDVALSHREEFTAAYNEALNRAGFGLQRVKYDRARSSYQPPFFIEFAPGGPGTPAFRFSLRLEGEDFDRIRLTNLTAGSINLEARSAIRSARDLCEALCGGLASVGPVAVVGKAATFAAELRRWPRALGLPRQGSKYAPMVDFLMAGLQERGALPRNDGLLLRIGLNALERLEALGQLPLRLPRFLEGALGHTIAARDLAREWREVAARAREELALLGRAEFGQHVHLAKILAIHSQGRSLEDGVRSDGRLERLVEQLAPVAEDRAVLARVGGEVPAAVGAYLDEQLARRQALLERRRALRQQTPAELEAERRLLECELLLIYAAYVRRLWQRAESLPYVNDRPYSLVLYLLFGPEFFRTLCRRVEFDVESTSAAEPVPA